MFSVGDFIVYGANGVCKITNIGPMAVPGTLKKKMYYTMTPCYIRDSSIFTPVDNERVVMRKVMTRDEAVQFIDEMDDIEMVTLKDIINTTRIAIETQNDVVTVPRKILRIKKSTPNSITQNMNI